MADVIPIVHPGSFCGPLGALGKTGSGTPMHCRLSSDARGRWGRNGPSPARRSRPRGGTGLRMVQVARLAPEALFPDKLVEQLSNAEVGALRRAAGLPFAGKRTQKRTIDNLTKAGLLDEDGQLTTRGRDALHRHDGVEPATPEDPAKAAYDKAVQRGIPTLTDDEVQAAHSYPDGDPLSYTMDRRNADARQAREDAEVEAARQYRSAGSDEELAAARNAATPGSRVRKELDRQSYVRGLSDGELDRQAGEPMSDFDRQQYRDEQARRQNRLPVSQPAEGDVDEQIRAAYRRLAGQEGNWVNLQRLRDELPDRLGRADVDAALSRLATADGVNLEPEANQKMLTGQQRDAAVRVGGEDRHLLSMTRPVDPDGHNRVVGQGVTGASDDDLAMALRDPRTRSNLHDQITAEQRHRATAAAAPRAAARIKELCDQIEPGNPNQVTREQAAEALAGLSTAELKQVAEQVGVTPTYLQKNKDELRDHIVAGTVGTQLKSDVLRNLGMGPKPASTPPAADPGDRGFAEPPPAPTAAPEPAASGFERLMGGKWEAPQQPAASAGRAPSGDEAPRQAKPVDTPHEPAAAPAGQSAASFERLMGGSYGSFPGERPVNSTSVRAPSDANPIDPRPSVAPVAPNGWGTPRSGPDTVNYHGDGVVGRAVQAMPAEQRNWDVDGQPLQNVVGRIATKVVSGDRAPRQAQQELRALAARMPAGSQAQQQLRYAADRYDGPDTPPPVLPAAAPEPIRRLAADLHRDYPWIREDPRELDGLREVAEDFVAGGRNRAGGLGLISRVQQAAHNMRHESDGDRGKMSLDRRVLEAVAELEALRKADRTSLYPPEQRG